MKTVRPVCSNCGATVLTLLAVCPACDCLLEIRLRTKEDVECKVTGMVESYFPGNGLVAYKDGVYRGVSGLK